MLLHIKFCEKPVSLIKKLQPLSYQSTCNVTPRLPLHTSQLTPRIYTAAALLHPQRPRGSQSGREKRRHESFQVRAKEPLGTDSHRIISKNSSGCRLLIGHKKCFVLLCLIGEHFLLSSFREFVHDGYCLDHGLSGSCTGNPGSVIVPQYGSSKITVFVWGKNTILKFLGNTK